MGANGAGMARKSSGPSLLDSVAGRLSAVAHVEEALYDILQQVGRQLGLDCGWVWLIDAESGRFYRSVSWNMPPWLEQPVNMTGSACWCIRQFRAGTLSPRNVPVLECSRLREAGDRPEETRGLRFHVSVPLSFRERPLGIMNLTGSHATRALSAEELHLLSTVGAQIGIALERERLAEEGRKLARAEERARLARELHDELAQRLTGIALGIEGAQQWIGRDDDRAQGLLGRALEVTRASMDDVRRWIGDMRLDGLAGQPLDEALAALGRDFTADSGIPVRLRCELEGRTLPLRVEAELFRIAQEALTNVRRHADARNVDVDLAVSGGRVRLSIRDDGRGIQSAREAKTEQGARSTPDPPNSAHAARTQGHGLRGIQERAALLGGRLRISGGGGTRITVTVPLS